MESPSTVIVKEPANVARIRNDDDVEALGHQVNEVASQVDELQRKVKEIESFFLNSCKQKNNFSKRISVLRENDKVRLATNIKNHCDHEAASERMQDLMCQFGTIVNQITQKKGACSSLDFIGMKDLGLDNSFEVGGRPRDFSTIRKRMEIRDASRYKHVREIYADVRSVLKDAMRYNNERSEAHVTARTLLAKFEEKWLMLLPKIMHEEERREQEEAFQKAYHAQMAKEVSKELYDVDVHLKELRELVVQRCRRISTLDKRQLGKALAQLSAADLRKALDIVALSNPAFQATAEVVDLDIDAQDESTLRQLKYFVLDAWQAQGNPACIGGDNKNTSVFMAKNSNSEQKRETSDAFGKSSKKKFRKSTM